MRVISVMKVVSGKLWKGVKFKRPKDFLFIVMTFDNYKFDIRRANT